MKSTAPDVTTYLQQVPAERRACLTALRQLCRETLIDYTESMDYGMPSYTKNGIVEVGFAQPKKLYLAVC